MESESHSNISFAAQLG
ncbi:UNVERIFIED_CONTAM: hypothetical protein GTU68_067526 [Idotea baltica]|nr:hypothetical protein [Idotea baltica]